MCGLLRGLDWNNWNEEFLCCYSDMMSWRSVLKTTLPFMKHNWHNWPIKCVCRPTHSLFQLNILFGFFEAEKHLKCHPSNSLTVMWAEDLFYMLVSCRHPTLYWAASWPVSIHGWFRWWKEGTSCTSLCLWKIPWLFKCYIWQERKCSWSSWKPHSAGQQCSWRYVVSAFESACGTPLPIQVLLC